VWHIRGLLSKLGYTLMGSDWKKPRASRRLPDESPPWGVLRCGCAGANESITVCTAYISPLHGLPAREAMLERIIGAIRSMSPRLLSVTMMSPMAFLNACAMSPCIAVDPHATANAMNTATSVSSWTRWGGFAACRSCIVWCMCVALMDVLNMENVPPTYIRFMPLLRPVMSTTEHTDGCYADSELDDVNCTGSSGSYGVHGRVPYGRPVHAIALPLSAPVSMVASLGPAAVDLSLASSYLPGIYTMLKVLVLLSALNIMQKLGMHIDQALIVCAACLYVDRCTSVCYILDTGGCALCVIVSVCVNASRIGLDGEVGVVNLAVSISWVVVSVLILCDSHRSLPGFVQIPGMVHLFTSSFCAIHGFLCIDVEIDAIAYLRAVMFTTLSVLWVYMLHLRERRDAHNDSCASCVDRFAVVLVADAYTVGVYALVACIVIVWRYRQSRPPVVEVACSGAAVWDTDETREVRDSANWGNERRDANVWGADRRDANAAAWNVERRDGSGSWSTERRAGSIAPEHENADDIDVHVAFRLAQENARKGVHAR
jgi:hypothetical protein